MNEDLPRVLIVEDNRALTQVLRFNFERAGFAASTAFDGLDAINQMQDVQFDLVVTDLQMPVMDGAELCHHIRKEMHLGELPIILCSAKGLEVDSANLVIEHGVSRVFYKPVSPQAVIAYARQLLETRAVVEPSLV